jgi:fatty acid desaturase
MKKFAFLLLLAFGFLLLPDYASAQYARGHRNHHRHARRAVIKSRHRPAKVVVFYPKWRPKHAYHRRWIYFPKYNVYFDNWRGHYVYRNGSVWASQSVPPPTLINVNLADVPHRELNPEDDDYDDIYMDNLNHQDLPAK